MKKVIILLLLPILLISCKEKGKENEKEKQMLAEKNREIKKQVLELCSKYNAVSDWASKIDAESTEIIYTTQLQDIFLTQKEKPYLFFVEIKDIRKVNDKYLIIAHSWDYFDVEIHLRVNCDSDKIKRIIKEKQTLWDIYALLVNVQSIYRPDFYLQAEIDYDDVSYDEVDYDIFTAHIIFDDYSVDSFFILKGNCVDVLPVGDYGPTAFLEDDDQ